MKQPVYHLHKLTSRLQAYIKTRAVEINPLITIDD